MSDAKSDEQREREAFENFVASAPRVEVGGNAALDGAWGPDGHWEYNSLDLNSHWLCWRAATRRFA